VFSLDTLELTQFGPSRPLPNPFRQFKPDPSFFKDPRKVTSRGAYWTEGLANNVGANRGFIWDWLAVDKKQKKEYMFERVTDTLEEAHNHAHVLIGGWMGSTSTAAFDPIFWLHHAHIDRLLAMFQAIHPKEYLAANEAKQGLAPFHKRLLEDTATTELFSSEDVRLHAPVFRYQYPDLLSAEALTDYLQRGIVKVPGGAHAEATPAEVAARASRIYLPERLRAFGSAGAVLRAAAAPAAAAGANVHVSGAVPRLLRLARVGRWFVVWDSVPRFLQGVSSYTVSVFLGLPGAHAIPTLPHTDARHEHFGGSASVFSGFKLSDCDGCNNRQTTSLRVDITAAVLRLNLTEVKEEEITYVVRPLNAATGEVIAPYAPPEPARAQFEAFHVVHTEERDGLQQSLLNALAPASRTRASVAAVAPATTEPGGVLLTRMSAGQPAAAPSAVAFTAPAAAAGPGVGDAVDAQTADAVVRWVQTHASALQQYASSGAPIPVSAAPSGNAAAAAAAAFSGAKRERDEEDEEEEGEADSESGHRHRRARR
jgi:hypothetical protein